MALHAVASIPNRNELSESIANHFSSPEPVQMGAEIRRMDAIGIGKFVVAQYPHLARTRLWHRSGHFTVLDQSEKTPYQR